MSAPHRLRSITLWLHSTMEACPNASNPHKMYSVPFRSVDVIRSAVMCACATPKDIWHLHMKPARRFASNATVFVSVQAERAHTHLTCGFGLAGYGVFYLLWLGRLITYVNTLRLKDLVQLLHYSTILCYIWAIYTSTFVDFFCVAISGVHKNMAWTVGTSRTRSLSNRTIQASFSIFSIFLIYGLRQPMNGFIWPIHRTIVPIRFTKWFTKMSKQHVRLAGLPVNYDNNTVC